MQLYFVRHGESTANVMRAFIDGALTEKGLDQARALAQNLSGLPIERIYSSPLLRAVQTAQILVEHLGAPLQLTDALREPSAGINEGMTDPGWKLALELMDSWLNHQQFDSRMPGGESFHDVQGRFAPFIEGLIADGRDADRSIVLVGHAMLYMAMLPAICKNVDFPFAWQHGFPNTAYTLVEIRPDGLYCLSWCGTLCS
jgi:broad specificity phosphatase PhoE